MAWILIIPGMFVVGTYETKERCDYAAKVYYDAAWSTAVCIPAPDR